VDWAEDLSFAAGGRCLAALKTSTLALGTTRPPIQWVMINITLRTGHEGPEGK